MSLNELESKNKRLKIVFKPPEGRFAGVADWRWEVYDKDGLNGARIVSGTSGRFRKRKDAIEDVINWLKDLVDQSEDIIEQLEERNKNESI